MLDEKDSDDEKYVSMKFVLEYGILMSQYYLFKNKLQKYKATKEVFLIFYNYYLDFDNYILKSTKFKNNHRTIKFELLKSKYLGIVYNNYIYYKDELSSSLKSVDIMFNKNIFNDESIDFYLHSKVNELKYDIEIYLKENK